MAAGGEAFAILTFLVGSGVAIAFLDWLLGGVGEAFGIEEPWGDIVEIPPELRLPGNSGWGVTSENSRGVGKHSQHGATSNYSGQPHGLVK